ncbi:uncharacterized protein J7T54_005731 [Emericellopsis cladophorae]|uniref:S-adenosylmethionine mitochondrial carrier protein n=1 Tax=Emericellopsis cladophorae TaxID=2686198 RepID=A0A9P9XXZ0_9HYPO|nr:uncharacterized protein J7T54_005731 [Emericellopsis cladophorae]KAI6779701.1 hypothetical protein J7T54_005731 [Emericellopsis cladophorae]
MAEIYLAGAVAAFTVDLLVYPLDTLKTRYQSQDFIKTDAKAPKPLAFRGLYQGVGSVILATLPAAGIFFSTYESGKRIFGEALPIPDPLVHSLASSVAEMASCAVLAPAEVIKQNAQMLRSSQSGPNHESTSLRAFRELRRGALQFPLFEHLQSTLWKRRGGEPDLREKSLLETGTICGTSAGTAGAFAAWITTPSDVVKTRMMLSAGEDGEGKSASETDGKTKRGAWAVTRQVWNERGLRGFFRGGLFRSAWTALGSGLYLGTYETSKVWLKRRKPGLDDSVGM